MAAWALHLAIRNPYRSRLCPQTASTISGQRKSLHLEKLHAIGADGLKVTSLPCDSEIWSGLER